MQIYRKISDATGSELTVAYISKTNTPPKSEIAKDDDLIFRVKTYSKLGIKQGPQGWDTFYGLTNKMLAELSQNDQERLYEFYQKARDLLTAIKLETLRETILALRVEVLALVRDTELLQHAVDFVEKSDIPYPNLDAIGKRVQDREDLTFRLPEYKVLTALSLVCKTLSPVWGDFVVQTSDYVETMVKEMHCYTTLLPVIEHPVFSKVATKLIAYVNNQHATTTDHNQRYVVQDSFDMGFITSHAGFGEDRLRLHIVSMLFIKKLAIYDPLPVVDITENKSVPDIMKYISSGINMTCGTAIGTLQRASKTMVRITPTDRDARDSDSTTALEAEAMISDKPYDTTALIRYGVDLTVDRLRKSMGVPATVFKSAVAEYMKNRPSITSYGKLVLGMLFQDSIGGAKSLLYLDAMRMAQLITLAQVHMIKTNQPDHLIHFLSAQNSGIVREDYGSSAGQQIRLTYESSYEYRQCVAAFPSSLGAGRDIQTQISTLVNLVTTYDHYQNTAQIIADFGDLGTVDPSQPVIFADSIIADICTFLTDHRSKLAYVKAA
jgi:hypothetical protein